MKTRNGFVSNSSSSSFVIAKTFLTPDQLKAIKDFHSKMKGEGKSFGDNGDYLTEDKNYISFDVYYIHSEFSEMCEENGIDQSKLFYIDG